MNIKSKIPSFHLLLLLFPIFLCILSLLFPDKLQGKVAASTVTPSGHTSFSQSFCLTYNLMISANITPVYNTHYYYMELAEPASVTLNFTHNSQGHFDFLFYSLDENTKYTAATDKSSYNWKIKNLAAGRYYLVVSCTFYTCTEEQYTLSCSHHTLAQTTSTPAAANPNNGNSVNSNSATDNSSTSHPTADGSTSSFVAETSSEIFTDDEEKPPSFGNNDSSSAAQEKNKDKNKNKKTDTKKNNKSKNKKILIRSLQLKNKKKSLYTNSSLKLKPHIRPKTATNQSLRFCSSDNSVAHVSQKGRVRALKKGIVDITVKSVDGSHLYATYTLKIKEQKTSATDKTTTNTDTSTTDTDAPTTTSSTTEPSSEQKKKEASITATSIRLSNTSLTLHAKKSTHIKASVLPADADDKNLDWKSLNPQIASVSHGKISANSPGITTIIVSLKSNPSIRTSCTITVK